LWCLSLSFSLSFSLLSLSYLTKKQERAKLINKTPSLRNKSSYRFVNTQLRITPGVLFLYDAVLSFFGRMSRRGLGEKKLAWRTKGLLPASQSGKGTGHWMS
jgi:hypothetical protein